MASDMKHGAKESVRSTQTTAVVSDTGVDAIYRMVRTAVQKTDDHIAPRVVEPILAVSAIPWRCSASGAIELFLVQRAPTMAFLPGYWCFPGGGVSSSDYSVAEASTPVDDLASDASGAKHASIRDKDRLACMAALIRELAEETGYVLDREHAPRVPVGRIITPAFSPIRFDVQFFLLPIPPSATLDVQASKGELVLGEWIGPRQALDRWQRGEWVIASPSRRMIEALVPGIDGAAERCQAAAAIENDWPRVYEMVPGVAKTPLRTPTLPPATHTGCYILGERELVVVDPASPYDDERGDLDRALDFLQQRGCRVVEIWLTHHHGDHVGGAAHLRARLGVPIAAHSRTAELLAGRVIVDRMLEDGEIRELDGDPPVRLRVVYTPGHAPGHVCIFEERSRCLVAGDMIAGIGTILIEPTEGDMALYLDSLARLAALAPAAVLPAHGPDILGPEVVQAKIAEYITHRSWREERVVAALAELGEALPRDLVPLAYRDVAPAIYPLAERSLIAHLIKLGKDGRVHCTGESWHAPWRMAAR